MFQKYFTPSKTDVKLFSYASNPKLIELVNQRMGKSDGEMLLCITSQSPTSKTCVLSKHFVSNSWWVELIDDPPSLTDEGNESRKTGWLGQIHIADPRRSWD